MNAYPSYSATRCIDPSFASGIYDVALWTSILDFGTKTQKKRKNSKNKEKDTKTQNNREETMNDSKVLKIKSKDIKVSNIQKKPDTVADLSDSDDDYHYVSMGAKDNNGLNNKTTNTKQDSNSPQKQNKKRGLKYAIQQTLKKLH